MVKINCDTREFDELLLDVLIQACGIDDDKIDTACLSAYETACRYLVERGHLYTKGGRVYTLRKKEVALTDNDFLRRAEFEKSVAEFEKTSALMDKKLKDVIEHLR